MMKLASICAHVSWMALTGVAAHAAPLTLYDDFSADEFDRARWAETESWRMVDGGKAALGRWIYGGTASDSGTTVESFGLSASVAAPPASLSASMTVTSVLPNEGCTFNPTPSRPRARLIAAYFNVRPGGPVPGDRTGDILGLVQLSRTSNTADPPGVLRVQGIVAQCLDAACLAASTLYLADLGTAATGTKVVGRIDWAPLDNLFRFTRDKSLVIETPYTEDDALPPAVPLQALSLRVEAANCASGPKVKAGIAVAFDNVRRSP